MRRATTALALLLVLAMAPAAASQEHEDGGHGSDDGAKPMPTVNTARIGFDSVSPAHLDILKGESVRWTNDSSRVHTVTADDLSFDSGRLSSSNTFTRRFGATGEKPYHCMLHPLINGVVSVRDLLLDAPAQAAAPGRPFALTGRTALPQGTSISIEADSGAGFAPAGTATAGADGGFSARIAPKTSATYRAVAGTAVSRSVGLLVLDRQVALTVRRLSRGRVRLQANVTPATRGGRVVLQLFLPKRFGWWPVQEQKLGASSRASFTLHPERRLQARVRYTLADGATALATSRTVRVGPAARTAPEHHHDD